MKYILALTTALVALVAAAPAPRNFITLDSIEAALKHHSVAGQPISSRDLPVDLVNGVCGGSTGYGCQTGYCCSEWGYCGNDANYCGVGCQFGACLQGGAAASPSPVAASIIGPASSVVQASSTTDESAPTTTAAGNKAGGPGGFGPGGAPTWSAPAWSAPSQPTTLVTSVWSAPSTTTVQQPTTTQPATTSSTPVSTPASTPTGSSGGAGLGDKYTMYKGDGTTSAGWPSEDTWLSFDAMWNNNLAIIKPACANNAPGVPNNTDEENADLKAAILASAASTGVDARFILAIVLQESKGCVRIYTTDNGVRNPGLMQDHNGMGTCNSGTSGAPANVQTPCPSSMISQMIEDGVAGTMNSFFPTGNGGGGWGLQQSLASLTVSDVSKYYKAARVYNSGSASADLTNGMGSTNCYSSDVANRLTGWVLSATACH